MMEVIAALFASLGWGTSDFLGGSVSKKIASSTALLWSSLIALPLVIVVVFFGGNLVFDRVTIGWGIIAGLGASLGVVSLYRGLASGQMGVVAPIASLSVVLPVVVGVFQGERPDWFTLIGVILAVIGVVLASGPNLRQFRSGALRPILFAFGATLGIGISLVAVANGSDTSSFATLLVTRLTYPIVLITLATSTKAELALVPGVRLKVAASGFCDVAALTAYSVATESGSLPVIAALSSLFPLVVLLLARYVAHEHLERVQLVGALVAIAGTITIVSTL